MGTDIKTWEIVDDALQSIDTSLIDEGRKEALDLERWLLTDPSVIRPGLKIIGRQVTTRSGPLDLLAVDQTGNLIVIELKRDRLPREALTQAIDYASDLATWSLDKLSEVCTKFTEQSLEDAFTEAFPGADLESISFNDAQRIILVGFSLDGSLERMIEWLSNSYGVAINAVVLRYARTSAGNEILMRSAVISEQVEEERVKKRKYKIPMSDEPGNYELDELRSLLKQYLLRSGSTNNRIRRALLPACLENQQVTRDELKAECLKRNLVDDPAKVGYVLVAVSSQISLERHDFLRQVVGYSFPNNPWEKDNYFVRPEYKDLVREVLAELDDGQNGQQTSATLSGGEPVATLTTDG